MEARPALEREDELARVRAAFDDAAGGAGRLVVIEGPPGIGKTRLVEDARALAKSLGFVRMKAVGEEPEQGIPWGVARQLVERSILRYGGETRNLILEGPAGRALEAINAAPGGVVEEAELARTLHALWWVAADLSSERPLLISVDDAQWADASSLRFLAYLARRLEDLSVCLVVGTRPPGPSGPLAELAAGRVGERLLPAPLSPAAVATLIDGVHPDVASAVHAASSGNPFYAQQLFTELQRQGRSLGDPAAARVVADLGPRTIARGLLLRLSPPAWRLAGAAAVLGAWSAPRVAEALAGLDPAAAAEAADELRRAHVLGPDVLRLAFEHPVVREAVLAELGPGERAALHAAAARTLQDEGAPDERIAAQLAHAPAGSLPGAERLLRTAADRALAQGDAASAVRLLRRVREEDPDDADVQAQLGFALIRADEPEEGGELLRGAAARTSDEVARARRLAAAAEATAASAGPAAAIDELRVALARETFTEPQASRVLDARLAMASSFLFERSPGSGRHLRQFADLPGDTVEERTLLALLAQRAFNQGDPTAEVRALALRALGEGSGALTGLDLLAWGIAVYALIHADGVEEAEAAIRTMRRLVRDAGSPSDFVVVAAASAQLGLRTGDLARAAAEATAGIEALALAEPGPHADGMRAVLVRQTVFAALERSDLQAASDAIVAFDRLEVASTVPVERLREARAALALAREDPAGALVEAEALAAAEARAGADTPTVGWRRLAALAAARLGDDDRARQLAAEQLASARRWGAAAEMGEALRLVARVGLPGEPVDRLAVLEEAVALLEPAPTRLVLAGALCDLGDALRIDGRRTDARLPLRRASDLADACGSTALRARALDSLGALGDRPRRLQFSGRDSLTAGERRVAELAAVGRTNRNIAQELFITPKTVENHLGRAYSKLGIAGRRELAGVFAEA